MKFPEPSGGPSKGWTAPAAAVPMQQVIIGSARDRWPSASIQSHTPSGSNKSSGARSPGTLTSQWELFDLMEQNPRACQEPERN